jgi:RNA polymerase sigma-70 factor (ECF subfamily)
VSRRWVEQLHPDHPRHEEAVSRLHDALRRAALHELHRQRGMLASLFGPEAEDVAEQCADDALVKVLAQNLFDARRKLRRSLAAAGYPLGAEGAA